MSLTAVLFLLLLCFGYRLVFNNKYRAEFILISSLIFLFWIQPKSAIRGFDFWIPYATLFLGILAWVIISPREMLIEKTNIKTILAILIFITLLGLTQYLPWIDLGNYFSSPPLAEILVVGVVSVFLFLIFAKISQKPGFWTAAIILISTFIILKSQQAAFYASKILRQLSRQSTNLANSTEIVWIGYSYFAFRILHTLIDWRKGRLKEIRLMDYINYVTFFPSFLSGPISRLEYFAQTYFPGGESVRINNDLFEGVQRLLLGIFQKFIVGDFLATFAINQNLAHQITSPVWMWMSVIAYSVRLYFDFSGYTHIAIGLARILGIQLPENFDKPFRAPTLTLFWNKWHITLTQWFRSYYFNPVSRKMKRALKNIDPRIILLVMQLTTMILIGLWHGISINFVVWGVWTGGGLFIQNQISSYFKKHTKDGRYLWQESGLVKIVSISFTFLFVSLGWVWFALPTIDDSMQVLKVLF